MRKLITISSHAIWMQHLVKPLTFAIALAGTSAFTATTLGLFSQAAYAETTATSVSFSQAELDQMLAPVALYPDILLSQVLIASTYPLEIVQADRWAKSNRDLKGEDAIKFVQNKDWDASVKALVAYPDLLQRMSEDLDWTQRLGDAFLADEGRVMDTVQNLRNRAANNGSLDKAEHVRVIREDRHIVIEPRQERVVYVPVYDPVVVYGRWWWADHPPRVWSYPSSYVFVNGFYWGNSVYMGNNYYYSSGCRWHDRRVVVVDPVVYRNNGTRFYTNVSITRFSGAREWQHNPTHRRGVAYYDDNMRDTYHSNRDSYERDRHYRNDRADNNPDIWRNNQNDRRNERAERQKNQRQNRFDDRYLQEHPELNRPYTPPVRPQNNVMTPVADSAPSENNADKAVLLQDRLREHEQRDTSNNERLRWGNAADSAQQANSPIDNRTVNNNWQDNQWRQRGNSGQPYTEQEARDRYYRGQQFREQQNTVQPTNLPGVNTQSRTGIQVVPNSAHFPEVNNTDQRIEQRNSRFENRVQQDVQPRFERQQEQNVRENSRDELKDNSRDNVRESRLQQMENRLSRER